MIVRSAALSGLSGVLTRPCCVVPAAMSVFGVSSAGIGAVVAAHRTPFLVTSVVVLVTTNYVNFRRDGGAFNKWVSAVAGVLAFALSAGVL